MNPALLLCLIVFPVSLISSASLFHVGAVLPASFFALLAVYPIGIAGWQLVRFTKHDPDRLQRDEHVQRMFQLQHTLGVKDEDKLLEITVSDHLTGNPALEDRHVE